MTNSISEPGRGENAAGGLIVLDFDGVLCDSLPECFVSSWHAHDGRRGSPHPAIDPGGPFGRFARLRPYVRSGEDFLLIHEADQRGLEIRDQPGFDALIAAAGPEGMADRKRRLYETRERLLSAEPGYWLGLNPIYPHLRHILPRLAAAPMAHILSTKRSDLVIKILAAGGVPVPPDRVHSPGAADKLDVVLQLMALSGRTRALFLDDQVDYFRNALTRAPGVDCRLAAWGYVRQEWLTGGRDYRVLEARDAPALLEGWLTAA